MNGAEQPKIVEIVDEKGKPYEGAEQEVPQMVLSKDAEAQTEELLGSKKAVEEFKKILETESENIESEHEAPPLVPNTLYDYNKMHAASIERRDHFNLVFENLIRELKAHEEAPKEGDTPMKIRQRVLNNLGVAVELAAKEAEGFGSAIRKGGERLTGKTREERMRQIRKEAPGI